MAPPAASSGPALERPWPLTGRRRELAQIASARPDPECPAVVISGPSGVGRTRLAREACAAAEADGELVYWARATVSSAAIPLGAFAALIPDELRSDEPLELIRRSTERMSERAAGRAVCVGIDDADLLDEFSAALVPHLATAAGAFGIATIRAGATPPAAIDVLWKDAGARRIELGPLDGPAIERLVAKVLDGPVEQSVLRRAADTSAGNPLYARELVLGAIDEGRLTLEAIGADVYAMEAAAGAPAASWPRGGWTRRAAPRSAPAKCTLRIREPSRRRSTARTPRRWS